MNRRRTLKYKPKKKKREILAGNTNNLTNPFQGDATEEDTMKKRRNKILEQKIV